MDNLFEDPNLVLLPPQDVRVMKLEAQSWPDRQRVHILLEFTPFQKHPNVDISLLNQAGEELGSTLIIESVDRLIDFNMYLRVPLLIGFYTIKATTFYEEQYEHLKLQKIDENQPFDQIDLNKDAMIVDCFETTFEIT